MIILDKIVEEQSDFVLVCEKIVCRYLIIANPTWLRNNAPGKIKILLLMGKALITCPGGATYEYTFFKPTLSDLRSAAYSREFGFHCFNFLLGIHHGMPFQAKNYCVCDGTQINSLAFNKLFVQVLRLSMFFFDNTDIF